MGGTMRLGLYPAVLAEGSVVREVYGEAEVAERHRHRYEVNNEFRDQIAEAGLVFSGLSPDGRLVEYVELPRDVHPYFVGTQAHPEFRSRPTQAHPLFSGLVAAALERKNPTVSVVDTDQPANSKGTTSQGASSRAGSSRSSTRARKVAPAAEASATTGHLPL